MKVCFKTVFLIVFFSICIEAFDLDKKYPSYAYVFNEFDVDKSYIYNDEFNQFVLKHDSALKSFYKRSLKRGKDILPTMKGILVGEGVSDLFLYLSMIESGFSPEATSPKKAVGLWQFMPATAKQYNLTVCNTYDERCDTVSATSAAIQYLNKLHRQFGKWYLAAMAYNCGEGCVQKAIKRAETDNLSILIDNNLKYIPKETRDYIKKILLVAMIGESNTLGFDNNTTIDSTYIEVEVKGGTDLKTIASLIKMKEKSLSKLNPKIRNGRLPNNKKIYSIRIPLEKVYAFYLRYELLNDKKSIKPHLLSHYVSLGETLVSIANKYSTTVEEIIVANNLENDYLILDQFLVIPVSIKIFEKYQ